MLWIWLCQSRLKFHYEDHFLSWPKVTLIKTTFKYLIKVSLAANHFYRSTNSQRKYNQGIPKEMAVVWLSVHPIRQRNLLGNLCSELGEVPLFGRSVLWMSDIVFSAEGLIKLLIGLNPSQAMDPDELHLRIIRDLAVELGPVLTHLFQESLDTGVIPKESFVR